MCPAFMRRVLAWHLQYNVTGLQGFTSGSVTLRLTPDTACGMWYRKTKSHMNEPHTDQGLDATLEFSDAKFAQYGRIVHLLK